MNEEQVLEASETIINDAILELKNLRKDVKNVDISYEVVDLIHALEHAMELMHQRI